MRRHTTALAGSLLLLVTSLHAADPVVSNVRATVAGLAKSGNFTTWTIRAQFDLQDADGDTCRIWAGLKTSTGFWLLYEELQGDTFVRPGTNYAVTFTVTDTGTWDSCRVRITAWDGDSWPPWPNQPYFARHQHWGLDVSKAPVHTNSTTYMTYIKATHEEIDIDADFPIFTVLGNHPKQLPVSIGYDDESDSIPIPFAHTSVGDPVDAYTEAGGDQHMHFVDVQNWLLYETYVSEKNAAGPLAWDVMQCSFFDLKAKSYQWVQGDSSASYPLAGYRGEPGWTSADAAGLAILPGLVMLHEIDEGEVHHAFRFTVDRTGGGQNGYVYPAEHAEGTSGQVPMGLRLRLKQSIDLDARFPLRGTPGSAQYRDSRATRIIVAALQRYGMICADGGKNSSLMAERDNHTVLKWADLCGPRALIDNGLTIDDFEVVDWQWQYQQYLYYESLKR